MKEIIWTSNKQNTKQRHRIKQIPSSQFILAANLLELSLLDEDPAGNYDPGSNGTRQTLLDGKHSHEVVLLFDVVVDVSSDGRHLTHRL